MHLTWKLSDDIVIVLCFDGHSRFLSEKLLTSLAVSVSSLCCTEVDKIL